MQLRILMQGTDFFVLCPVAIVHQITPEHNFQELQSHLSQPGLCIFLPTIEFISLAFNLLSKPSVI